MRIEQCWTSSGCIASSETELDWNSTSVESGSPERPNGSIGSDIAGGVKIRRYINSESSRLGGCSGGILGLVPKKRPQSDGLVKPQKPKLKSESRPKRNCT